MKIETKFNIGDEVWYMYGGRAFKSKLEEFTLRHDCAGVKIIYKVLKPTHTNCASQTIYVNDAFPTKQALLESL